jgi:hypothetical protein
MIRVAGPILATTDIAIHVHELLIAPCHERNGASGVDLPRVRPFLVTCGRRLGKSFLTVLQHWSPVRSVSTPVNRAGEFSVLLYRIITTSASL